ncbi:MAG: flagellar protein FlgN [Bacterioplanes sp.]|nr:flagellar protein FlgN [Bacterioplanes sp.]
MNLDTDQFAQHLASELSLTTALQTLLKEERQALVSQDIEQLQALQATKQALLNHIQSAAHQRLRWMEDNQLPTSPACLEHPQVQSHADIATTWQALAASYEFNRDYSEHLSDLVLKARYRTQQQLKILHGRQNDSHLYNQDGKASGVNRGKGYVQA